MTRSYIEQSVFEEWEKKVSELENENKALARAVTELRGEVTKSQLTIVDNLVIILSQLTGLNQDQVRNKFRGYL